MIEPSLATKVGPIKLKNPVMPASGCFNYGLEFEHAYDLSVLGGIVNKTFMDLFRAGNSPDRVMETPEGMLNAIGTPSKGTEQFLGEQLPYMRKTGAAVIASIGGLLEEDFERAARKLDGQGGIAGIELDLSCPNHAEAAPFANSAEATHRVVRLCRAATRIPLIAKLGPAVTDIVEIAAAALEGGADALCIGNTYPAMSIDVETQRPILGFTTGGLSGPAVRPMMVRHVWAVVEKLRAPVIGCGGIESARDAIEYLLAGARAVQVGTANYYDPMCMPRIIDCIRDYLRRRDLSAVEEIIGAAHRAKPELHHPGVKTRE
ncbi:MAG: dihydroorotate dehydrogenase [Nitrospinota bacterium]